MKLKAIRLLLSIVLLGAPASYSMGAANGLIPDVSSSRNGAFVLYSSVLAKGIQPSTLLDGQTHLHPFATESGPHLMVIDLGKAYRLEDIQNLPPNAQAYILNKKPDGNATWTSLIAGLEANKVAGRMGQYLVLAYDKAPLVFSDPLVDAMQSDAVVPIGAGFGLGNTTPLSISPIPAVEFISH